MRDIPAFDDENLWFPAHMSAGESFSRPLTADGAATGTATGAVLEGDGIGLPRRRPSTRSSTPRRRKAGTGGIKASSWVWLTVWGVAALGIATYAARKDIVIELAQGWLKGQGVPARLRIDTLSLGHATGSFILGNPGRPDLSAGRFDADFSLNLFAGGGRPLARLKTAHLDHVGLHLSYKDGKLGFGTLDRLVHTLSQAADTPPREVTVGDATVTVDSDYGILRGHGSTAFRDGQLSYLSLKLPAAHLDGARGGGDFGGADILVRTTGRDGLQVEARANAAELDLRDGNPFEGVPARPVQARGVTLDMSARVPQGKAGALSGALDAAIAVTARSLRVRGATATDADYRLKLSGAVRGRTYDGTADITARAGHLSGRGVDVRQVVAAARGLEVHEIEGSLRMNGTVNAAAGQVRWRGMTMSALRLAATHISLTPDDDGTNTGFNATVTARDTRMGGLDLSRTTFMLTGEVRTHRSFDNWSVRAQGPVDAEGSYGGLSDLGLGHAFDHISLHAQSVSFFINATATRLDDGVVWLPAPAEADLANGATLTLTSSSRPYLFGTDERGGFNLTLNGPGGQAALMVDGLALSKGAFVGNYRLDGQFSTAAVAGAKISARGRFSTAGALSATLSQPLAFQAQSAHFGETFTHVSGRLGRAGDSLLRADGLGWRIDGTFTTLAMDAPSQLLAFKDGQGTVSVADGDIKVTLDAAKLDDMSAAPRFRPLTLSGNLTRDARTLAGRFTAAAAVRGKPMPIVTFRLDGDRATGKGQLGLRTLGLDFTPGGLQPGDLSPMAAGLPAGPVSGWVGFDGAYRWDGGKTASSGVLTLDGLSFGAAHTLRGKIDFTSLAPWRSRPDQVLFVDRLDIGLPLSALSLHLQVRDDHIAVDHGTAQTPGGPVRLEPMVLPFDVKAPVSGAIAFDGLDFGKIVAATDLASGLTFEGRLSGRVPFSILGGHATFADGWVKSDGPGSMSIRRRALSGLAVSGSLSGDGQARPATVPATSHPFQDLAYQALEHLSYDRLDAQIRSRPDGRLDALWHVEGRFAPPAPRQATMSLDDYLDGAWAAKPLALPSGTPVDLYLDMPFDVLGAR